MTSLAVNAPDDLEPDQITDAFAELGARLASDAAGRKIECSDIIGVTVRPTPEQIQAAVDDAAHQALHIAEAFILAPAVIYGSHLRSA